MGLCLWHVWILNSASWCIGRLHFLGPEYFLEDFRLVSEIYSHQSLRSASSTDVMLPAKTWWFSLGDWAFTVAGARAWNALPPHSVTSLSSFRRVNENFSVPATTVLITLITVSWSWSACTQHHVYPGELNWSWSMRFTSHIDCCGRILSLAPRRRSW